MAISPDLGLAEGCVVGLEVVDGVNTVSDTTSVDGVGSVSSSAVISVFGGSLSATSSEPSAERKIGGVSSNYATISAVTAGFIGSAGKIPDLGSSRPHSGTQRDTVDDGYSSDNLLFHLN